MSLSENESNGKEDETSEQYLDSFQCPTCKKVFSERTKSAFDRHLQTCGQGKYTCDDCGKTFISVVTLRSHFLVHNAFGEHVCKVCNKTFKKPYSLKQHLKTHKDLEERTQERLNCEKCGKTFAWRGSLQRHMQWHFKPDCALYNCACGQTFRTYSSVYRHRATCKAYKSLKKAERCESNMGTKGSRKLSTSRNVAVKVETDDILEHESGFDKPTDDESDQVHKCQFCDASFKYRADLDNHVDKCDSDSNAFIKVQCVKLAIKHEPIVEETHTQNENKAGLNEVVQSKLKDMVVQRIKVGGEKEDIEDQPNDSGIGILRSKRKRKRKQFTDFEVSFDLKYADENEQVHVDKSQSEDNHDSSNRKRKKIVPEIKCKQCDSVFANERALTVHVSKKHPKEDTSIKISESQTINSDTHSSTNTECRTENHEVEQSGGVILEAGSVLPTPDQSTEKQDMNEKDDIACVFNDNEECKDSPVKDEIENDDPNPDIKEKRFSHKKKKKVVSGSAKTGIKGERITHIQYRCTTANCSMLFSHKKFLDKHKIKTHQEKVDVICTECRSPFCSVLVLRQHLRMNHSNLTSVLLEYNNTDILNDMDPSKPEYISICPTCGYMFKGDNGSHDCVPMELRYFCPCCDEFTRKFSEMEEHIRVKHADIVMKQDLGDGYQAMRTTEVEPALKIHEGETTCNDCGEHFETCQNLKDHANTRHATHPFCCGVCRSVYGRPTALLKHLSLHMQATYKCSLCPKEFYVKTDLDRHVNMHTGDRKYQCDQCGKSYCDERAVNKHLSKKHPKVYYERFRNSKVIRRVREGCKSNVCHICGMHIESEELLEQHMKRHNSKGSFSCPDCQAVFDKKYQYEKHKLQHLPADIHDALRMKDVKQVIPSAGDKSRFQIVEDSGKYQKCSLCNFRFKSALRLRKHMSSMHMDDDEKRYHCEVCGKAFVARSMYTNHIRIHSDDKPYVCRICGRKYKQLAHIREHLRYHGKQVYTCAICYKPFKTKSTLLAHANSHCKQFPYVCPSKSCSTRFRDFTALINHSSRCFGKGQKKESYQCGLCDEDLLSPAVAIQHMYVHKSDEVFSCQVCSMAFNRYRQLYLHKNETGHFLDSERKNAEGVVFQRKFAAGSDGVAEVDWPAGLDDLMKQFDFIQTDNDGDFNAAGGKLPNDESEEDARLAAEQLTHMAASVEQNTDVMPMTTDHGVDTSGADPYPDMTPAKTSDRTVDVSYLSSDIVSFASVIENEGQTEFVIVDENPFQEIINIERGCSTEGEEIVLYVQSKDGNVEVPIGNNGYITTPETVAEEPEHGTSDRVVEPSIVNGSDFTKQDYQYATESLPGMKLKTKLNVQQTISSTSVSETRPNELENVKLVKFDHQSNISNDLDRSYTHSVDTNSLNSVEDKEILEAVFMPTLEGRLNAPDHHNDDLPEENNISAKSILKDPENTLFVEISNEDNIETQFQSVQINADIAEKETTIIQNLEEPSSKEPIIVDETGNVILVYSVNEAGEQVQVTDSQEILNCVLESGKYRVEETCVEEIDHLYASDRTEQNKTILDNIKKGIGEDNDESNSKFVYVVKEEMQEAPRNKSKYNKSPKRQSKPPRSVSNLGGLHGKLNVNLEELNDSKRSDPDCVNYKVGLNYYEDKSAETYPHQCDVCKKRFKIIKSLNFHKKTHLPNDQRKYRCEECGAGFHVPSDLEIHRRIHTGDKPFKCTFCTKAFRQLGHLQVHLRRHEKYFPFQCDTCGKNYVSNAQLKTHLKQKHSDKPEDKVGKMCEICNKPFKHLDRHMLQHVDKKSQVELLERCNNVKDISAADTDDAKDKDDDSIDDQKKNICDVCGIAIKSNFNFKKHMMRHQPGADHVCSVCSKGFSTPYLLKEHMLNHTHMVIATPCEICGIILRSKSGLRSHLKRHHKGSDIDYQCAKCKSVLNDRNAFLRHVTSCMKEEVTKRLNSY